MVNWLRRIKHAIRLHTRWRVFRDTPQLYPERFRYALRRSLLPEIKLCVWVTSPASGACFRLSSDPIDDAIVQDIVSNPDKLFPKPDMFKAQAGVVLDIGGHHGLYAAEALRRFPDRRFIVVEPHPGWCDLIKRNLAANGGAARARIVNACLAADRGRRTLHFDPDSSWGANVQAGGDGLSVVEVESLPLLDILQGEAVAMIYCNAEGAEYTLVPQLQQTSLRPEVMVMCVHPEYGDSEALRRQVCEMGYAERDASANPNRPVYHYMRNRP
jgi:FkbM family methyltransferase